MWTFLNLFLIFQAVSAYCPVGFDLVNESDCRGNYTTVTTTYSEAIKVAIDKCNEVVGHPIVIHNEEDNTYWKNRVKAAFQPFVVIGLVCDVDSRKWKWADGTELDFKPTRYSDELLHSCRIGWSWLLESEGSWSYSNSESYWSAEIFCWTQSSRVPFPYNDGCDSFEEESEDGVCYQVTDTAETWLEAEMNCKKLGANLASIHTKQENAFLRRLAVSKGAVSGMFLGAEIAKDSKKFAWIDGSEWDYENFYPGFPMPGIGDCLAMDTSTSSGQWMNTDCSSKLPVACVRERRTLTDPTCSTGPWKEDTLIHSPGFPYSASTPCDFFLTVDASKKVELLIVYLEANSCCDSLILYDGFLGGNVIASLTGEVRNTTYTSTSNLMRVSWQPKSNVNVMGLTMKFHGIFKRSGEEN